MPTTLGPLIRRAMSDARLSSDEVTALKQAVSRGEVKPEELTLLAQRYGDLFQAGAGVALTKIAPSPAYVTIQAPIRSLGDQRGSAEVLNGAVTLRKNSPQKEAVTAFQRAMLALANRAGKPEWSLPKYGADGGYGDETIAAVSAFQKAQGLPVTGEIDQTTALAVEYALMKNAPPAVGGVLGPSIPVADGDRIAQAAKDLIAKRALDYGVPGTWRSPNPSVPGNAQPGVTKLGVVDRWKCNLFGMDALYAGGAQTPHYPGGNYPIAVEIPNYARGSNAPLIKLGEVWPGKGTPEEAKAKIEALMKVARPGDVIIVNHPGTETADGGHTRVVVGNSFDRDGKVDCAQAGRERGVIEGETIESFTGEEAFYLLRPALSR